MIDAAEGEGVIVVGRARASVAVSLTAIPMASLKPAAEEASARLSAISSIEGVSGGGQSVGY